MTTTISTPSFTPAKMAEEVGVGVTTIKTWSKELNILPQKNSSGRNFFSESDAEVFKRVKELRNENKGLDSIRSIINSEFNLEQDSSSESAVSTGSSSDYNPMSIELVKQEIRSALAENNDLADRYAKATYTIGKLEERIIFQEEQIKQQEESIKLLPAANELQLKEADIRSLESKNEQLHSEIERLQQDNLKMKTLEEKQKHLSEQYHQLNEIKKQLEMKNSLLEKTKEQLHADNVKLSEKKGFFAKLFGA